jgi:hypothetical protein
MFLRSDLAPFDIRQFPLHVILLEALGRMGTFAIRVRAEVIHLIGAILHLLATHDLCHISTIVAPDCSAQRHLGMARIHGMPPGPVVLPL